MSGNSSSTSPTMCHREASTTALPSMMTYDEFQSLTPAQQSRELFELLWQLAPVVGEVSSLRTGLDGCLRRLAEVETAALGRPAAAKVFRDDCTTSLGLVNDLPDDQSATTARLRDLMSDSVHPPDTYIIAKSRQMNRRVTLNVGGTRHEVMWRMLESVPRSRLGRLATQVIIVTLLLF